MGVSKRQIWNGTDWNDGCTSCDKKMKNVLYRFHVYRPDYPGGKSCYVRRAHVVWWLNTKQVIPKGFCIHHKNGDSLDDQFENLELLTAGQHTTLHHTKKRLSFTCKSCGKIFYHPSWYVNSRRKRGGSGIKTCSRSCSNKLRIGCKYAV